MEINTLTDKIIDAAKHSFSRLISEKPNEKIYVFILYTDEDCYTVLPAANSMEMYEKKIAEDDILDDAQELAAYKWSSAEWAYEASYDEKFLGLCKELGEMSAKMHKEGKFLEFKKYIHKCMTDALKCMDEEDFFGHRRNSMVLYISSSDADEAIAMENMSAEILNPREKYELFLKRYG